MFLRLPTVIYNKKITEKGKKKKEKKRRKERRKEGRIYLLVLKAVININYKAFKVSKEKIK